MFYEDHGKSAVPFFFVHGFDNKPAGIVALWGTNDADYEWSQLLY